MIITEAGYYKTLEDITLRGSNSIGTFPKGKIINITQIDKSYHKVCGPDLSMWLYWDLPVERVAPQENAEAAAQLPTNATSGGLEGPGATPNGKATSGSV